MQCFLCSARPFAPSRSSRETEAISHSLRQDYLTRSPRRSEEREGRGIRQSATFRAPVDLNWEFGFVASVPEPAMTLNQLVSSVALPLDTIRKLGVYPLRIRESKIDGVLSNSARVGYV
jgi:hypothetical protein